MIVNYLPERISSACQISQACYEYRKDVAEGLRINVTHWVTKICPSKTFLVKIANLSNVQEILQSQQRLGWCDPVHFEGMTVYRVSLLPRQLEEVHLQFTDGKRSWELVPQCQIIHNPFSLNKLGNTRITKHIIVILCFFK